MNTEEVYPSGVLAKGEWQLLCINRIPCSLTQVHVAVTATAESTIVLSTRQGIGAEGIGDFCLTVQT